MPVQNDEFCQCLVVKSKGYSLAIFIAFAIILEFIVHYTLQISIVYTHLFYLIIIIAAIWFQRKAVLIAIFFGLLHIGVTYLVLGYISADSVFRACILCMIAYIVGSLVRCLNEYREEEVLEKEELKKTQDAYQTANKKLNILSSITRHDILNQLTALLGYQEIAREMCNDASLLEIMKKEQHAADAIRRQIEFTRHYQDIGIRSPVWHNISEVVQKIRSTFQYENISIDIAGISSPPIEIYADPLFPLICENLIDNSIRHGEHVTKILFSSEQTGFELILIYQDNGVGITPDEKAKIFNRGFGKHTGMGLFLTQEILAITDLSIRETGEQGKGVRFEIFVPAGSFQFVNSEKNPTTIPDQG
ncbi:HAMP domain-containing sensor histidine kinase [uncultured Methanospirillum sp.]|uniref:sensor histidine kinase n=1 Tax=uncultured Methanospirillum sp. TaxID=262503 RepID=UPI0029C94990|nr:HAMP domain-containing sensor histidine kinase [uncultured Methanospirillum sp.]